MSFRIRDPKTLSTDQIGFTFLDENFNPIGKPSILARIGENSFHPSFAQDPRLILNNGKIWVVYSNVFADEKDQMRRMVIGSLHGFPKKFIVNFPTPLLNYEGNTDPKEKNWVPFIYENSLLLSYSINPHVVFMTHEASHKCETVAKTNANYNWSWGELRGGTPALKIDNQYLAFFHSSKSIVSEQSSKTLMTHYFMGAYTFNSEPPFALTAVSPHPIVSETFYKGPMYVTWKPLRVVFPGGYVYNEKYIWVVYGRQDHECWVVKLDKKELLKSLKKVKSLE